MQHSSLNIMKKPIAQSSNYLEQQQEANRHLGSQILVRMAAIVEFPVPWFQFRFIVWFKLFILIDPLKHILISLNRPVSSNCIICTKQILFLLFHLHLILYNYTVTVPISKLQVFLSFFSGAPRSCFCNSFFLSYPSQEVPLPPNPVANASDPLSGHETSKLQGFFRWFS